MNIVFICSEYPYKKTQATGGFGRYVETISVGLVKLGHRVEVVCKSEKHQRPLSRKGVQIRPTLSHFSSISRIISFIGYPILWSWAVKEVIKKIDKENSIDIIEGGDFGGELFFHLLFQHRPIPTVIKLHTPSFIIQKYNDEPNNIFYQAMDFLESFCIRKASCLNSPTKDLAHLVSRKYNLKINDIIPYPVKTTAQSVKYRKDKNMILYTGKLQYKKGVFVLLNAIPNTLKRFPQAKFVFIGPDTHKDGKSTKQAMFSRIKELGIQKNVIMLNEISSKKIKEYFKKSVIAVVPSLWENFPNVILEAIQNNSAVVGSKVGGISEMIQHMKTGLLVSVDDADKLSKALCLLLSNKKLRDSMAVAAKKTIKQKYEISKITKQTIEFYNQCLPF